MRAYHPEADFAKIEKAYRFAEDCHKNQFRASGEAYFMHPEAVAMIVARELRLDTTSICAALLHDVVEDTSVTLQDIQVQFGETMAQLVEGLTKLNKVFFSSATAAQAASFRKMLFAMTNDVRVILIKLADRLHNLRTLGFLPPVKQKYVAQETMDIYAPLAHRLGINKVKSEMEDVSFRYINPEAYKEIQEFLSQKGFEGDAELEVAMKEIRDRLAEVSIRAEISGRPKQVFSIFGKMQKHRIPIENLYDFFGVRVLTNSVKDCYGALGIVHKHWKPIPGRFKDYIAVPKPNMYQSLHTTVLFEGKPLEVQIRTQEMHRVAEEGIAAHWDYKAASSKDGAPEVKEKLSWLRNLIDWLREAKDASEFMETVKVELFQYHVYVFTPKGEVIELPRGSTPVDFAYCIHTDVGHRCIGAKVNGHIVPLEYSLQNGDIVAIITSKTQKGPSRDWLKFVQSTTARKKIRAWLKREFREEYIQEGEKLFEDTLHRMGATAEIRKHVKSSAFAQEVKNLGFPSVEELFAGIGSGEIRPQQVVGKLFPDLVVQQEAQAEKAAAEAPKPKASDPKAKQQRRQKARGPQVIVMDLPNALVKLSRCCNPIPGDPIVGYITRGRGVTVHRTDCQDVKKALSNEESRLIDVRWDMGTAVATTGNSYRTRIRVEVEDRTGMLSSVTNTISTLDVNILSASARANRQRKGVLDYEVEIGDINQLNELLRSIARIAGVTRVYRVDLGRGKK